MCFQLFLERINRGRLIDFMRKFVPFSRASRCKKSFSRECPLATMMTWNIIVVVGLCHKKIYPDINADTEFRFGYSKSKSAHVHFNICTSDVVTLCRIWCFFLFVQLGGSKNFQIGWSNSSPSVVVPSTNNYNVCATHPTGMEPGEYKEFECPAQDRYVIIQLLIQESLTLCEVKVFGGIFLSLTKFSQG